MQSQNKKINFFYFIFCFLIMYSISSCCPSCPECSEEISSNLLSKEIVVDVDKLANHQIALILLDFIKESKNPKEDYNILRKRLFRSDSINAQKLFLAPTNLDKIDTTIQKVYGICMRSGRIDEYCLPVKIRNVVLDEECQEAACGDMTANLEQLIIPFEHLKRFIKEIESKKVIPSLGLREPILFSNGENLTITRINPYNLLNEQEFNSEVFNNSKEIIISF